MFTVCSCFLSKMSGEQVELSYCNPNANVNQERIAILDADAHYSQIMDKCIRNLNIESDILPFTTPAKKIKSWGYKAVIILGKSDMIAPNSLKYDPDLFKIGLPVLGIDYGMQILNKEFGGVNQREGLKEEGQFNVIVDTNCPLFRNLHKTQIVFATRSDGIRQIAAGFQPAVLNSFCTGIYNESARLYGLQFHPEVDLTTNGTKILGNFLHAIAGLSGNYSLENREAQTVRYIQTIVARSKVFILLDSLGIYNVTSLVLLKKALPDEQIVAVYIHTGFNRKSELKTLMLLQTYGVDIRVISSEELFSKATTMVPLDPNEPNLGNRVTRELQVVTNAQEKLKITQEALGVVVDGLNLPSNDFLLLQATLRSDLFPSTLRLASCKTNREVDTIKSEFLSKLKLDGRVIEPLKTFYEEEIWDLCRHLRLPREIFAAFPLPLTGFAGRVFCADCAYIGDDFLETCAILKCVTKFNQMVKKPNGLTECLIESTSSDERNILERISSSLELSATLLPIKCLGTEGSGYAVGISSTREPDWDYLSFLAQLILRIAPNVARVCYIFGGQVREMVPVVIPTYLSPDVLEKCGVVDAVATKVLGSSCVQQKLIHASVILVPLGFDHQNATPDCSDKYSVVFRPTCTQDSMSLIPALPGKHFPLQVAREMVKRLMEVDGVSRVLYDLTTVSRCTIEWE